MLKSLMSHSIRTTIKIMQNEKKDSIDVDKLVASLKDNPDLLDKLLDALK